jgi:hypothetical protein
MKSEKDQRGLDSSGQDQKAKEKHSEQKPKEGEDGHEKFVAVEISYLHNNGMVGLGSLNGKIRIDKKLFADALSVILSGPRRNVSSLVRMLPKEEKKQKKQRKVLGCLTGNPLLEIDTFPMRKQRGKHFGREEGPPVQKGLGNGEGGIDNEEIQDAGHLGIEIRDHYLKEIHEFYISHQKLPLKDLPSQKEEYIGSKKREDNLIYPARTDRTKLQTQIVKEFGKADWYYPGIN